MPKHSAPRPPLVVHIELAGIEPAIWRRLMVPASITLPQLHEALQAVLGWHDLHLHEFRLPGRTYGVPDPDGASDPRLIDEAGLSLVGLLESGITLSYVYDLGDHWEHHISLEAQRPAKEPPTLPFCLAGANAGPPEDTGGPGAYVAFIEAMANPAHPEHEAMLEWYGQLFDPTAWDIERVNRRLKHLQQTWQR